MNIKDKPIKVYIKTNENNYIVDICSSVFIKDKSGYIEIDSGFGDKFSHAQSQYLEEALINKDGNFNYKYDYILRKIVKNYWPLKKTLLYSM